MTALVKLITLVLIIVSLSSCESRKHDDLIVKYERELSKDVSGYEFVNFEWFMAYTTKDSLNSKIADIKKAANRNMSHACGLSLY